MEKYNRIVKIQTYHSSSSTIEFAGTLRNEKEFDLLQNVFILADGAMHQCKIIGKELTLNSNPDYVYKIQLPEFLIEKRKDEMFIPDDAKDRVSLKCDKIFSTIAEAKQSALAELELKYQLNFENIVRFFERYEPKKAENEHKKR